MKTLYGMLGQFSVVQLKCKEKFFYGYLKNTDFTLELGYNSLREPTRTDKCGIDFMVWKWLI